MSKLMTSLTLAAAALLSACSTTSPDVIQRGDAQRLSQVQDATVLSSRPVTVDGSQSGIGGVAGNGQDELLLALSGELRAGPGMVAASMVSNSPPTSVQARPVT